MKKLSIIIPCYNEAGQISKVLNRILQIQLPGNLEKEILFVNDGSTDQTREIVQSMAVSNPVLRVIDQPSNRGKGAAIRTAVSQATGDIVLIQDADLEYDPSDYRKLLQPVLDGFADVVYGSRFTGSGPHRVLFFFHTIGNKFLTFLSNLFTGLNLTDMETGYKVFRTEILKQIRIRENRFGVEPELTAKVSRIPDIRIYEVGIAYYGRTYQEGKKINWVDGCRAIWCILKYNIFSRK